MPKTKIILFREADGTVPLIEWFQKLPAKAVQKCQSRLERLAELGHELRRPEADLLTQGIHELRSSINGIHYRILYFFHGNVAAVVSHGMVKEDRVPPVEIGHALRRKAEFLSNPGKHSHSLNA